MQYLPSNNLQITLIRLIYATEESMPIKENLFIIIIPSEEFFFSRKSIKPLKIVINRLLAEIKVFSGIM